MGEFAGALGGLLGIAAALVSRSTAGSKVGGEAGLFTGVLDTLLAVAAALVSRSTAESKVGGEGVQDIGSKEARDHCGESSGVAPGIAERTEVTGVRSIPSELEDKYSSSMLASSALSSAQGHTL